MVGQNDNVTIGVGVQDDIANVVTPVNVPTRPTRVLQEDLNMVAKWVKDELFETVKLVPNPEIYLAVNGYIYQCYLGDCGPKMAGLRRPEAVGEYRRMYCEMLWLEANRSKEYGVMKILTGCRSTVYSAAKERFMGKLMKKMVGCWLYG